MQKIRKILAPTDLSELSAVGVRYALEMAKELNAEVLVYHAVPLGEDWFAGYEKHGPVRTLLLDEEAALAKYLAERFGDEMKQVQLRQEVEFGIPYASTVAMAEREGTDMIVMSTHGRTGLSHMLLGSVTERVVAHAPCPVLAIPTHGRRSAKAA